MACQIRRRGGFTRLKAPRAGVRERQSQEAVGRSPPGHPRPQERFQRKALAPQVKREVIRKMIDTFNTSERQACRLVGLSRDSFHNVPQASAQAQALCNRMVEVAQ